MGAERWPAGFSTLGDDVPTGPIVLDTNVFINALARRGPPVLAHLLAVVPRLFVAAPTRAELSWVSGRLDPDHRDTAKVLAKFHDLMQMIDPEKVLVPEDEDWASAGSLAGAAARMMAGGGKKIGTAFDRVELISDALTATLAAQGGFTVVTEDADYRVLGSLIPDLRVAFYVRAVN